MLTINQKLSAADADSFALTLLTSEHAVCFDIETTGFSAASTQVYLIGCITYDGTAFQVVQWLAENASDEPQLLDSFFTYIADYKTLIHYNGEGFDMPYLLKRCRHYRLPHNFTAFRSIDLYKLLVPYKALLSLDNLKQKTLEQFLGLVREDVFQGGELISVYFDYAKTGSNTLREQLLLHNRDDLYGMTHILCIYAYYELFHGSVRNVSYRLNTYSSASGKQKEEIIFTFQPVYAVPKDFSCRREAFYLSCFGNTGKLSVQIYKNELKYFFPNYKDYYYLPVEDISIHKSVALYVDKDFRTQATAANCYNKKSGKFLPQQTDIVKPFFKQNYKDKHTYFEMTDEFLNDPEKMLLYVKHILTVLK